jgi:hypothetical protein
MENLSGRTVERAADLQHPAACVDARQQAVLAQPMPKGLLTQRETLGPSHLLGYLIAAGRI